MQRKLRVGLMGYEPVLSGDYTSAAPNGVWILPLVEYLDKRGVECYWVGAEHSVHGMKWLPDADVQTFDVMVFFWRWPMANIPKYKTRNDAYIRQMRLIRECGEKQIPFFVQNQDDMMDEIDVASVLSAGGKCFEPCHFPQETFRTLHFPWFVKPKFDSTHYGRLVYCGNNYDRFDMTVKYLGFTEGVVPKIQLYGNWLDPDPTGARQPAKVVIEKLPLVEFPGRIDQRLVEKTLASAVATIHLMKPAYAERGLMAIRFFEAAQVGTCAFIPEEFKCADEIPLRVTSKEHLAEEFAKLRSKDRTYAKTMASMQEEFVAAHMRPAAWLNTIFEVAGK